LIEKTLYRVRSRVAGKEQTISLALIATIVFCGIFYSYFLDGRFIFPDEKDYYKIAYHLAADGKFSRDGVQLTAWRPPGYPFFISLFIRAGASVFTLRIINFILFGLSIYILFLIVRTYADDFAALTSTILVILYPVLFYASALAIAHSLGMAFFLIILYLVLCRKTDNIFNLLLTGILSGMLILTVPYYICTFLIIIIWLFSRDHTLKINIKKTATVMITALLVISIWSVRNFYVFKTFVFIDTHGGQVLLLGNSEKTDPFFSGAMDISDFLSDIDLTDANEAQIDAHLRDKAIEYILSNKAAAIKLYFLKVLNYFNYANKFRGDLSDYTSHYKNIIMLVTYGTLFIVFLYSIIKYRNELNRYELLSIIIYFVNALFLAVFHTRIRFRLPFDFLLIGVVAMFVSRASKLYVNDS
jgi:hypothetical protein